MDRDPKLFLAIPGVLSTVSAKQSSASPDHHRRTPEASLSNPFALTSHRILNNLGVLGTSYEMLGA
jgi:hypothetical protein